MTDRERALDLVPVSRETAALLDIHVDLLKRWQRIKNLVAPSTLDRIWSRHIADSAQLLDLAPQATGWIDLGSGAGFPGLVIAAQLSATPGAHVTLVEADQRKCAFLRAVIRETGAPATVIAERIEAAVPRMPPESIDVVTARALAPLTDLVQYSNVLLMAGAVGLFPKGRDVERELTAEGALRKFAVELVPSRTDSDGKIAVVRRRGTQDDR